MSCPTWQLGTEGDALPVLAAISRVQQDGRLPDNPALIATEADRVEAVVETLWVEFMSVWKDIQPKDHTTMVHAHGTAHSDA